MLACARARACVCVPRLMRVNPFCSSDRALHLPFQISLLDVARSMEEVNPEIVALLSDGVDDDAPVLKRYRTSTWSEVMW